MRIPKQWQPAAFSLLVLTLAACTSSEPVTDDGGGEPAAVASVDVSPPTPSIPVGSGAQLQATLRDAAGRVLSGRTIAWAVGNPAVARINTSGYVTAMSPGTSYVIAGAEGRSDTALVTALASAPPPVTVASVTLSVASFTLPVGQAQQLGVVVRDASGNELTDRTVSWSAGNGSVASVSSSGLVSALGAGTSYIFASAEGRADTALLTVSPAPPAPVATVSVSAPSATMPVGATQQLTATLRDAGGNVLGGRVITWSSANAAVATVNASGLVTALASGTATITATSEGRSGGVTLTVTAIAQAPVASVSVTPGAATLTVGQTTQLAATTRDASGNVLTGRVITWSSANPAVASVSASGFVTAIGAGTATINAASEGRSGSALITVQAVAPAPVASVTVSPASVTLAAGATQQLSATLRDAAGTILTGRAITWQSSMPSVATVSASGLATAVSAGNATISATSEGRSGTASITVSGGGGGGGPIYTNEPAGMTLFMESPWNTRVPSGWAYADRDATSRIAVDATAPVSPSNVLEYLYPTGYPGGGEPAVHEANLGGAREVFVGFHFKFSPNWQGHASGINKILNVWPSNGTAGLYWIVMREIGEIAGNPYFIELTLPQGPNVSGCQLTYGGDPGANVRQIPVVPGTWYKVEAHWQGRTATSGGRIRWWLDGVLIGDFSNLSCAGTNFDYFQIAPTWGGVQGVKTQDDYLRFDHMRITTR